MGITPATRIKSPKARDPFAAVKGSFKTRASKIDDEVGLYLGDFMKGMERLIKRGVSQIEKAEELFEVMALNVFNDIVEATPVANPSKWKKPESFQLKTKNETRYVIYRTTKKDPKTGATITAKSRGLKAFRLTTKKNPWPVKHTGNTARDSWRIERSRGPRNALQAKIWSTVEYMPYLELGWSKKAPQGMVRVALHKHAKALRRKARGG